MQSAFVALCSFPGFRGGAAFWNVGGSSSTQPYAYSYSDFQKFPLHRSLAQAIFTVSSVFIIDLWQCISKQLFSLWENSRHLVTLPLVSPPNDIWETSAEIPYWWCTTTQIWVVLLIGWIKFPTWQDQSEALPRCDLGYIDTSSVWNFCPLFSDVIWRGNQW